MLLLCGIVRYYRVRLYVTIVSGPLYDIAERSPFCIVLQTGRTCNLSKSPCSFGKRQGRFKKRQGCFLKTNLCLFLIAKAAESATFHEYHTQQLPFYALFAEKRSGNTILHNIPKNCTKEHIYLITRLLYKKPCKDTMRA